MSDNFQENRINFNPAIWGSHGWFFLGSIILSYPNDPTYEQKQMYKTYFKLTGDMLPCQKCRFNYHMHLSENELTDDDLQNGTNLRKWWLKIQNSARRSMNKKEISLKEFEKYYDDKYALKNNTLSVKILAILCVIGIFLIWKKANII